jgi:glycosyltransferase involved in cell wall biosynthesis
MKIAIVRRGDPSDIDGVNRSIYNLSYGFSELGHKVTVFGSTVSQDPRPIFGVDVEVRSVCACKTESGARTMAKWSLRGQQVFKDADAIIVHGVVPLMTDTPKVAVNHGNAIFELKKSLVKRVLTRALYRLYDSVVCVSSKVAKEQEEIGIKCNYVIPPPIIKDKYNVRSFHEREEPFILHVGTVRRKRLDISINAMRILRKLGYNVKLVIIGNYNAIEKWVEVRREIADKDLKDLYSKALASSFGMGGLSICHA